MDNSTKLKLSALGLRDPLSWGIMHFDLLDGKQWEVNSRRWMIELYQVCNPYEIEKNSVGTARRAVITKSTQAGVSTAAMVKALHFAVNWPVRVGFTLPRQQDLYDLVSTRFDPSIQASPYLRSKIGQPNSAHVKRIGESYVYFLEMSVEPRSIPIDSLFIDEVDLSNSDNLATLLNRLDASRWKMAMYLSTPTVPNYGVHGLYLSSDMREWLVKCPKCNHEQHIDWDENLRVVGAKNNPDRVFYGCVQCDAEITVQHIQTGRWVAQHPDRSSDMVGYHVHQMLTTPANDLYKILRDPQTKLVEFYRKRLGKPYEIGGGSIERDDILSSCFDLPYEPEPGHDGKSIYYIGADQGNELQVLVAKIERDTRRPKIVHIEIIPVTDGFSRLSQLIQLYRARKTVVDGNPNRHEAIKLVKQFPGRVLMADYIEQQKESFIVKKGMKEFPEVFTNVTINRTTGFDELTTSIRDGEWQLPGEPPRLSPDVELLIDHVTAIKRDIETRRTNSGETQVAVWRTLRADHLAHAWVYLKTAINAEQRRNLKVAVVGAPLHETSDTLDGYAPDKDIIREITSLLAEVPTSQLQEFLGNRTQEEYTQPFPLSHKYKLTVEAGYAEQDILWVVQNLVDRNNKNP